MKTDIRGLGFLTLDLQQLYKEMEEVRGEWNGKEPGRQEDRADVAGEIEKTAKKLELLIDEFVLI